MGNSFGKEEIIDSVVNDKIKRVRVFKKEHGLCGISFNEEAEEKTLGEKTNDNEDFVDGDGFFIKEIEIFRISENEEKACISAIKLHVITLFNFKPKMSGRLGRASGAFRYRVSLNQGDVLKFCFGNFAKTTYLKRVTMKDHQEQVQAARKESMDRLRADILALRQKERKFPAKLFIVGPSGSGKSTLLVSLKSLWNGSKFKEEDAVARGHMGSRTTQCTSSTELRGDQRQKRFIIGDTPGVDIHEDLGMCERVLKRLVRGISPKESGERGVHVKKLISADALDVEDTPTTELSENTFIYDEEMAPHCIVVVVDACKMQQGDKDVPTVNPFYKKMWDRVLEAWNLSPYATWGKPVLLVTHKDKSVLREKHIRDAIPNLGNSLIYCALPEVDGNEVSLEEQTKLFEALLVSAYNSLVGILLPQDELDFFKRGGSNNSNN